MPERKPLAVANWKMAMTVAAGQRFIDEFRRHLGRLAREVDIVICPPYTALYPVAQAVAGSPIDLGGQAFSIAEGTAHTGEISADLLADVGCRWALVGHWEIRRRSGLGDADINRKTRAALDVGLRPILLIGESSDRRGSAQQALAERLPELFAGIAPDQVIEMAVTYEPEWTIGMAEPAAPDYVAAGCRAIRDWIARAYNSATAERLRIIYGGSVTPDHAVALLRSPQVDGLGAGRKGRDPQAFADIVRLISRTKGLT